MIKDINNNLYNILDTIVKVVVDRPIGSFHPEFNNLIYRLNYGHIENVIAPDGEEQDAYIIGISEPIKDFTGKVIAIIHRLDDIEDKLVVAPVNMNFTDKEIKRLVYFQEKFFKSEIIQKCNIDQL